MKLVITSQGETLQSQVDPRFGRAVKFILVDSESGEFSVHDNSQNLNATQGAGIQAAQNVVRLGAQVLITGHCGPKAFQTLQAAKVHIMSGVKGTVEQALQAYRDGKLQPAGGADVESHWV